MLLHIASFFTICSMPNPTFWQRNIAVVRGHIGVEMVTLHSQSSIFTKSCLKVPVTTMVGAKPMEGCNFKRGKSPKKQAWQVGILDGRKLGIDFGGHFLTRYKMIVILQVEKLAKPFAQCWNTSNVWKYDWYYEILWRYLLILHGFLLSPAGDVSIYLDPRIPKKSQTSTVSTHNSTPLQKAPSIQKINTKMI